MPSGADGAEIVIVSSVDPPAGTFPFDGETLIETPSGACVRILNGWSWPVSFDIVRVVCTAPGIGFAWTLGRLRSSRPSGSAALAT